MTFDSSQDSYQALRAIVAERTQPLLAWVGSGLSAPAGMPTWRALRDNLADGLAGKAESFPALEGKKLRILAEQARQEPNLWVAFEVLLKNMGQTTFREEIRRELKGAATAEVPSAYQLLAQMRIRGLLNLNIDRLATRGFNMARPSDLTVEHAGPTIARLNQVLTEPSRFIGNLHGTLEDAESWVFAKSQLDRLQADEAYQQFIKLALAMHTVIFLGISVDDLAIGGLLESLSRLKVEMPTHFWLSSRTDPQTDFWAEQVGIRVIRYDAYSGDHSAVSEFLKDLLNATPPEQHFAPPVTLGRVESKESLPPPSEMAAWKDLDRIRRTMNAHATEVLASGDAKAYEDYERFCSEYDEVIYRAWYVSAKEGNNELLGYRLDREVAKGAFGQVYAATSPDGGQVAIKLLLENIRKDGRLLHSFRRGVRSMRILSSRKVTGMVAYEEASEIPAFVVMEWVDGPNLAQAKQSGYIDDWPALLRITRDLTQVIRTAHALPERVLHRDIRPSNVMLKGYYSDPNGAQVVVLDFDLSWHRNAQEVSVLHSASAGYLAPEQLRPTNGVSTRNAAVDSFGLGMTFLFLCTGTDPLPDEHRHKSWSETVKNACGSIKDSSWKSAPARFARLILSATQDAQTARWDVSEIESELGRLYTATVSPSSVTAIDLLTEELAAHSEVMEGYVWNLDTLTAVKQTPTGLLYSLNADLQNERLAIGIQWTATGVEDRKGLSKYIRAGADTAAARLKASGWEKVANRNDTSTAHITAEIDASKLRGRIPQVASKLDEAFEKLRFG